MNNLKQTIENMPFNILYLIIYSFFFCLMAISLGIYSVVELSFKMINFNKQQ